MNEDCSNTSRHLADSADSFPRVPAGGFPQPDYTLRSATAGLAAGAANYIVSSEYIAHAETTYTNEASALAMAGSFAIFASIRTLKSLCGDTRNTPSEEKLNIYKGGVGGATLGASLAAATKAALLSQGRRTRMT